MTAYATLRTAPDAEAVSFRFADLQLLEGREFTGPWFSVSPDRLALFDQVSYVDQNPHGMSDEAYPEEMVEGFHLLSLLDHLMNHVLYLEGPGAFGWNYGFDRVRFVSPIRCADRIRLRGMVAEVRPKGDGFLLLTDCVVEIEGRERPGFVAQWWVNWIETGSKMSVVQQVVDKESGHS